MNSTPPRCLRVRLPTRPWARRACCWFSSCSSATRSRGHSPSHSFPMSANPESRSLQLHETDRPASQNHRTNHHEYSTKMASAMPPHRRSDAGCRGGAISHPGRERPAPRGDRGSGRRGPRRGGRAAVSHRKSSRTRTTRSAISRPSRRSSKAAMKRPPPDSCRAGARRSSPRPSSC
jgi:hypothetical protein